MTAEHALRPRQLELLKAAAELWDQEEPEGLNYLARLWCQTSLPYRDPGRLRRVLPQRKMCSRSVRIIEIRIEGSSQRVFMEHDQMIEAPASNGADHAFYIGTLPRRARCRQNFADPKSRD